MTRDNISPGLRLRQARERLGLTYRDVERSSYELASHRGRREFVLHISRLAEIENRGVVPGLHKLYTLAVIYHLNPADIFRWYNVPIDEFPGDAASFPAPKTHLTTPSPAAAFSMNGSSALKLGRTELLSPMLGLHSAALHRMAPRKLEPQNGQHRYGYIGLKDRRMVPMLQPGSIVLVDTSVRRIQEANWTTEYDRPMYFVELHDGYRCGWFCQDGSRLMMQPHPLSRCLPEVWSTPDEAEVVGRVVGMVTRLADARVTSVRESPISRANSSRKAP